MELFRGETDDASLRSTDPDLKWRLPLPHIRDDAVRLVGIGHTAKIESTAQWQEWFATHLTDRRMEVRLNQLQDAAWEAILARAEAFERGEDDLTGLDAGEIYWAARTVAAAHAGKSLHGEMLKKWRNGGDPASRDGKLTRAWAAYAVAHPTARVTAIDAAVGPIFGRSERWVRTRRKALGLTRANLQKQLTLLREEPAAGRL